MRIQLGGFLVVASIASVAACGGKVLWTPGDGAEGGAGSTSSTTKSSSTSSKASVGSTGTACGADGTCMNDGATCKCSGTCFGNSIAQWCSGQPGGGFTCDCLVNGVVIDTCQGIDGTFCAIQGGCCEQVFGGLGG